MPVIYDPDLESWDEFFYQQVGGGQYFEGVAYRRANPQTGAGVGAAFASFMRFLIPIAKTVGPILAEEGLALGSRLMGKFSEGESIKQNLKKESKQAFENLTTKIGNRFQNGQGRRRRKIPNLSHSLVGKRLRSHAPLISSQKPLDPFDQ